MSANNRNFAKGAERTDETPNDSSGKLRTNQNTSAKRMHEHKRAGSSELVAVEEYKNPISKDKPRKPLRPITAAVNSPARRAESKKAAWQKHVHRLRPVTALKKFDHLQEYRDRMPAQVSALKTDPESLAALRDSVTNFQAKFRQSILSGLVAKYRKKASKIQEVVHKLEKYSETVKADVLELEKKSSELAAKLEEVNSEIEGLQEQAQPLEDKVDAVQKMIQVSFSESEMSAHLSNTCMHTQVCGQFVSLRLWPVCGASVCGASPSLKCLQSPLLLQIDYLLARTHELMQDRGRQGKSERLEKELKEERSKMNTIKGKIREVQSSRQKINLHHQTAVGSRHSEKSR